MAVQFKWPLLGVLIPTVLISVLAYGSHVFVLRNTLSWKAQVWFEVSVTLVWISYGLAIVVKPGSPPKSFMPKAGEWRRYCKKCQGYKPERSHHCKMCGVCVLKMDHHCPWTYNCVGHRNYPHFMRFLVLVVANTGYVMVKLLQRVYTYYENSDLPSYLVDKKEMFAVIFLLPIDFFVFATVSILAVRCVYNLSFRGMTQIEVWELERIESHIHTERLWLQIRRNYAKLHGKEMPTLTSWNHNSRYYEVDLDDQLQTSSDAEVSPPQQTSDPDHSIVPHDFTIDDIVFPYDLGFWSNTIQACGYPWSWILPWGKPFSDGIHFIKNEFMEDDQLSLPWPPDGGHQDFDDGFSAEPTLPNHIQLQDIRRSQWQNDLGETLGDFGVDLDAEDSEHDDLLAK